MDTQVLAAMRRWPNVPAVAGWLSLDARGAWRLHEHGGAHTGEPGTRIEHVGMIAFIGRNYAADEAGRWFFQNGPQRVYVTLAAAPHVLRWNAAEDALETQLGTPAGAISAWWLDSDGRLYATCAAGPATLDDRELARTVARLRPPGVQDLPLIEAATALLPAPEAAPQRRLTALALDGRADGAPLWTVGAAGLPAALGFVRQPQLDTCEAAPSNPVYR